MGTTAKILSYPQGEAAPNPPQTTEAVKNGKTPAGEAFFEELAAQSGIQETLAARLKTHIGEIELLRADNRWQEILDLYHPVEEREPEMVRFGLDLPLRSEVAFALSRLKRYDDAIVAYEVCLRRSPDDFRFHSGLAYTLYESLLAAKNREIILPPQVKAGRTDRALEHFKKARELRPDGVTAFYREGMLYKNILQKPDRALPLLVQAVKNWLALTDDERKVRHQERRNYIKSLYNLGSCQVKTGRMKGALASIQRCIEEDGEKNHVRVEHKHFALGKVLFHLGRYREAQDALEFTSRVVNPAEGDYVFELLGRVLLAQDKPREALAAVERIPPRVRRPYVRWTEADVLNRLGEHDKARSVLTGALERDRRSRHRTLVRLAKMAYREGNDDQVLRLAGEAVQFHIETFTTPDPDGLFWQAAAHLRKGEFEAARQKAADLAAFRPAYPLLGKLRQAIAKKAGP
ncbi:tetratricopeptide repeat protein [Desulfatiglans anilini]|uniref:tetratricopeptide repeat protein n=1 Tax=Desulfatiglans anilini TaxID=90728 RepID=UPI000415F713|nr:tetratricopeptide repeat protein [Desulfatiglans anilini]